MATVITTSSTTAGNNLTLASGVDLFLASGVVPTSDLAYAVIAQYTTHALGILGTVYGEAAGVLLGGATMADTTSTMAARAPISSAMPVSAAI